MGGCTQIPPPRVYTYIVHNDEAAGNDMEAPAPVRGSLGGDICLHCTVLSLYDISSRYSGP
jgi:hypothetical protein